MQVNVTGIAVLAGLCLVVVLLLGLCGFLQYESLRRRAEASANEPALAASAPAVLVAKYQEQMRTVDGRLVMYAETVVGSPTTSIRPLSDAALSLHVVDGSPAVRRLSQPARPARAARRSRAWGTISSRRTADDPPPQYKTTPSSPASPRAAQIPPVPAAPSPHRSASISLLY